MGENILKGEHPGIGRLYYFLARILMILTVTVLVLLLGFNDTVIRYSSLAVTVAATILDVMRLRNIGLSQWFVFLRFIPYIGLLFSIGLQSAQGGWAESKRLDRAGLTILATHVAVVAVVVYLIYRTGMEIEIFGIAFR